MAGKAAAYSSGSLWRRGPNKRLRTLNLIGATIAASTTKIITHTHQATSSPPRGYNRNRRRAMGKSTARATRPVPAAARLAVPSDRLGSTNNRRSVSNAQ